MNLLKLKEKFKIVKSTEDLANIIVDLLQSDEKIEENVKLSNLYKYIIPLLLGYFSKNFVDDSIDRAKEILKGKTGQIQVYQSEGVQVDMYVKEYTKKYNVNEKVIRGMLKKETQFNVGDEKYNANQIGDLDNTLGASYGPGQIKISTAKEIYIKYPETDINPSDITADKLKDDIEFNIRTMCKLMGVYYDKFSKTKKDSLRWALAATAYNRGLSKAMKSKKPNKYGMYASKSTDKQSLFREFASYGGFTSYDDVYSQVNIPIKQQLQNLLANLPEEEHLVQLEGDILTLKRSLNVMDFESPSMKKNADVISEDVLIIREKLRSVLSKVSQLLRDMELKSTPQFF